MSADLLENELRKTAAGNTSGATANTNASDTEPKSFGSQTSLEMGAPLYSLPSMRSEPVSSNQGEGSRAGANEEPVNGGVYLRTLRNSAQHLLDGVCCVLCVLGREGTWGEGVCVCVCVKIVRFSNSSVDLQVRFFIFFICY